MGWQHTGHIQKQSISFGDSPSIDAFARSRVSQPFTLFDSKQIWDDPDIANSAENFPLFFDNQEISGAGTTTVFDVNRASTTLGVTNVTAGTRVRQSKQRFNYQPGKSQLVILTGVLGVGGSGIIKRLGYFDGNNGVFFQNDDAVWSVVIRSFVSGAAVDTVIIQSNWNLDTMDGNGTSGIILDKNATQIFFIDFEWLGVGRVRFGFFIDGVPVYAHEFLNANVLNVVYMSTPNLPVRFEISNDGTGGADTIEQICSTVVSEGGVQANGAIRSSNLGALAASEIQAGVVDSTYAVCGIRLKTAYLSADIEEVGISMLETVGAANAFMWSLHFNPTLTTGLSYTDVLNSAIQFGAGLPAGDVLTDLGTVMQSGYVSSNIENVTIDFDTALRLGSLIDGTRDEIVLGITPITANQDVLGSLTWKEAW